MSPNKGKRTLRQRGSSGQHATGRGRLGGPRLRLRPCPTQPRAAERPLSRARGPGAVELGPLSPLLLPSKLPPACPSTHLRAPRSIWPPPLHEVLRAVWTWVSRRHSFVIFISKQYENAPSSSSSSSVAPQCDTRERERGGKKKKYTRLWQHVSTHNTHTHTQLFVL